ncbi:hypothetical protein F4818DRAFT_441075 [Hypoxylon cercidicola]|nr:hypothetical protein F4818DRAFT_441075 [Hypoxylon cercidicola]
MANSKAIPQERRAVLQKLYNDLVMWLNFNDETKHFVQQILDGEFVEPFFREYRRDYLEVEDDIEEVDCAQLEDWCQSNNAFALPEYTSPVAPDKREWTVLHHAARFLVRVLRFSWENNGEWTHGRYDPTDGESGMEFIQVCLILMYLQAEWEAANLEEWDEADLNERIAKMGI